MALIDGETPKERLHQARTIYEDERGIWRPTFQRMLQDYQFVSGDQWDKQTKDRLISELRPALTFNLTKQVVAEFVGANEDVRKRMRAVPTGVEDLAASEILDTIWRQIYNEQNVKAVEREIFENAVTGGLGNLVIDFAPDPMNPDWFAITITPLGFQEVYWDSTSRKLDYADAQYVIWPRWISDAEFKEEFPDKALLFDELRASSAETSALDSRPGHGDFPHDVMPGDPARDYVDIHFLENPDFFHRKDSKILLIHMEYVRPIEAWYVHDPQRGWVRTRREQAELLKEQGQRTRRLWTQQTNWIEFTGAQILFDDKAPNPLTGFSVVPMVASMDRTINKPYGVVRDLKDPQREINKRYSYEVDLVLRHVQPGAVVEEDAVVDVEEFNEQTRTPGMTAVLRSGGIQKYQERPMPQIPTGVADLATRAYENFQRVAGLALDPLIGQRSASEPVGTALLRHRQSLMAITPILEQFRGFQKRTLNKVLELILKVMPDQQIVAMLGNPQRWQVQNGVVVDTKNQSQVSIRDLRAMRWDIEVEASAQDTTGSMLVFQSLVGAMQQAGMAIPPDVVVEYLPIPRDQQAKTLVFMQQQLQQQQQQAQIAQAQATAKTAMDAQQLRDVIRIELAKVDQRRDAQLQKTVTDRRDDLMDFLGEMAKVAAAQEGAAAAQAESFFKFLIGQAVSRLAESTPEVGITEGLAAQVAEEVTGRGAVPPLAGPETLQGGQPGQPGQPGGQSVPPGGGPAVQ